jgi:hypothetical protein
MQYKTEGRQFIYLVRCPVTGEPAYVGRTRNLGKRRLNHQRNTGDAGPALTAWRAANVAKGLVAIVEQLELVCDADASPREAFWIAHYRSKGPLLNVCSAAPESERRWQHWKR